MKKVIALYAVLIVAFVLLAIFGFGRSIPFFPNLGGGINEVQATAKIGDTSIELLVADNDEEKVKGLSERDNLPENQGMVFVFEEKGNYSFWMKNMRFPIDIIFLDGSRVVNVYANVEPAVENENPPRYTPTQPINYVLELNAGKAEELGITEGSTITIEGL